jgi:hypothetical protein
LGKYFWMLAQMLSVFLMLSRERNAAPGPPFSRLSWVNP